MFRLFGKPHRTSQRRNATRSASNRAASTLARDTARAALERAVARRDHARERALLVSLRALEPAEPRWPHKLGDALHRAGEDVEAGAAYRSASALYAELGFGERAAAMKRLARALSGQSRPLVVPHPSLRPDSSVSLLPLSEHAG